MARPGVTYLEVVNAAKELIASSKSPTIENIRIKLGTGSHSTIGAHLKTWKAHQDNSQQVATKEHLPQELVSALKGVWDKVMAQSEEKIQTIEQDTQQIATILKQEIQQLQKDNAQAQQQYQNVKTEKEAAEYKNTQLEKSLSQSNLEVATLTEKLKSFEERLDEKELRIKELHRQNQQVQNNLEHFRQSSLEERLADKQRFEQQQKQFEQIAHGLNQELAKLKAVNNSLQQENQQLKFENESLKIQLDKITDKEEKANLRLNEALNQLTIKTKELEYAQAQAKKFEVQYETQQKLLIELQTKEAVLSEQHQALKREFKELQEHNKLLAHDKWLLVQEKAQLIGQLKNLQPITKKEVN